MPLAVPENFGKQWVEAFNNIYILFNIFSLGYRFLSFGIMLTTMMKVYYCMRT